MTTRYRGRHVLVFGLGRSGQAAACLLAGAGASVRCADEHLTAGDLGARQFETRLGTFEADLLAGIDEVVVSPGVPAVHPLYAAARAAGVPVIGELELAFRFARAPVIAVTGTNGKSTVVSMIGAILAADGRRSVVAGNVGLPFSAVAVDLGPDGCFVIEVSSFQLETTVEFHPRVAGLLNMTPDHLDRYADVGEYYRAKERIVLNLDAGDRFFFNAEDPRCRALAERTGAVKVPFSAGGPVEGGVYFDGRRLARSVPGGGAESVIDSNELGVVGRHNIENALAAVAAVSGMGVSAAACRRALSGFPGLPHRMERVAEFGGVVFYNDSKATNVEAVVKSLAGLGAPVVLIAGGHDKGGDFSRLLALAGKVRSIVTIGEAAPLIEDALGDTIPCRRAGTMRQAVAEAARAARPGWLVVLAPACASFDMFDDFEHRGEVFRRSVLEEVGEA